MYLGAAVLLWLVRAWKIGDLEEKAAAAALTGTARVEPVTEGITAQGGLEVLASAKVEKTAFVKRIFKWQRV
jgi:hypothetical protein